MSLSEGSRREREGGRKMKGGRERENAKTNLLHLSLIQFLERIVARREDREADEDMEFERRGVGEIGV